MKSSCAGLLAALALGLHVPATAQKAAPAPKKETPSPTFEVTGTLADAKGPLANKIVRVGPVDAQGNMLAIRNLGTGSAGADGETTSDAQGRFTVTVGRSFFRNSADDSLGLRVSTDVGGGRMSTAHEVAIVKIDSRQDKVDAGRVVLQPLKPR
jgi:hypothetical protein